MSDYLFDKEGPPDPEVERLEQLLSPFALGAPPPRLLPAVPRRRPRPRIMAMGAAGAVLAAAAAIWLMLWWPGRWIETGAARVQLPVSTLGTVELAAHTRARFVERGDARARMELARGTLSARIDAAPRRFSVETRYLKVIDLGCAFSVTVDESGRGRVEVSAGSVALVDGAGRELVLAAGAACSFGEAGPGVVETPPPAPEKSVAPVAPEKSITPAKSVPAKSARAKSAAPAKAAPTKSVAAPVKTAPAKSATLPSKAKSAPDSRFSHDSLKDLDRSLP